MFISKRNRYDNVDPSKPAVRFNSVLRVVQSYGEYEKLLGGVFENYLRSKFKDCYFESVSSRSGHSTTRDLPTYAQRFLPN